MYFVLPCKITVSFGNFWQNKHFLPDTSSAALPLMQHFLPRAVVLANFLKKSINFQISKFHKEFLVKLLNFVEVCAMIRLLKEAVTYSVNLYFYRIRLNATPPPLTSDGALFFYRHTKTDKNQK